MFGHYEQGLCYFYWDEAKGFICYFFEVPDLIEARYDFAEAEEDLIYFIVEGGFELLWRVEHEILLLIHVESIENMSEIGGSVE